MSWYRCPNVRRHLGRKREEEKERKKRERDNLVFRKSSDIKSILR